MFKLITILLFTLTSSVLARNVFGYISQNREDVSSEAINSSNNGFLSDVFLVYKIYRQCAKENISKCLKVKLILGLDKAIRKSKDIKLLNGVEFTKDKDNGKDITSILTSESDIEKELPRSLEERDTKLNSMIFDKLLSLIKSHTLQIKLPSDLQRSYFESRKKDKKNNGAFVMIPLLLGGTFIPIAYGALALLAGKALIVSKLALVLASIIGIKKLLSSTSGKESQHEVVVSGGHSSGSGWGRDFDLAYKGHIPNEKLEKS